MRIHQIFLFLWFQAIHTKFCLAENPHNIGEGLIVSGEPVRPGEAPFQLALLRNDRYICGASLISYRTALTAAHCVYGFDRQPDQHIIRYSTLDYTEGPAVSIQRIAMHPAFALKSYNFDLALLTLTTRIQPSNQTQIIPLASKEPISGSSLLVTGWGQTGPNDPPSPLLLRAELRTLDWTDCAKRWGSGQPVLSNMFCAIDEGQSSCKGDSGGPVAQAGVLVGVVSWGSSQCLHPELPNVFVNLAKLEVREWINVNLIN